MSDTCNKAIIAHVYETDGLRDDITNQTYFYPHKFRSSWIILIYFIHVTFIIQLLKLIESVGLSPQI